MLCSYASSVTIAAAAAMTHTPVAPKADDVGAGVPAGGAGVSGAVALGASVAPGAAVTVVADCAPILSVPTAEYTDDVLVSHEDVVVDDATDVASCDTVLPLPEYTANCTTSDPTDSAWIVMYRALIPNSVARSFAIAVFAAVSFTGSASTADQLPPLNRSVTTMSGFAPTGENVVVVVSNTLEPQTVAHVVVPSQPVVLPVWFASTHRLYVHDWYKALVLSVVAAAAASCATYRLLPYVEQLSDEFDREAVVPSRHVKYVE